MNPEQARPASRVRASLLAFVLPFALLMACWACLAGCAPAPAGPLWADPGQIRLDASRTEVAVEIHNVSGSPRPIGEFVLGGEDWGVLRFVDDSLPRTVASDASVVVRLAVSPASLRLAPAVYRSAHASLRFRSDQHEYELPIEFVGTAAQTGSAPPAWLASLVLALLGAGVLLLPRSSSSSSSGRARGSARAGLGGISSERLAVAGACAALLLVAAMIPLGAGYCAGRLGARLGPAELEQCRAGLGGFELTLLPASPGLWWWLIGLSCAAALLALVRVRLGPPDHAQGAAIALSLVRVLGFALILAALLLGLAPAGLAPSDLVFAQLRAGSGGSAGPTTLALPAWGAFAQPLACAAALALAAALPAPPGPALLGRLTRLERLIWSALLTTTFLGGWLIPGFSQRPVPLLTHAGTLGAELLAFALELALVDLALRKLGELLRAREIDAATLLRAHARWTIPLVFVNLIGVLLWRLLS